MNNIVQMSQEKTEGRVDYLDLDDIQVSPDCQPREAINKEIACEYAVAMTEGDEFPPVIVFFDGKTNWLADGYHRYFGARSAKEAEIKAKIYNGSKRDAVLYSCGANAKHGIRRTNADKKRAILTLLKDDEWSQWSDREVARQCLVDHETVGAARRIYLANSPDSTERKCRRGDSVYTVETANIGKGYDPRKEIPFFEQTISEERKKENLYKGTLVEAFVVCTTYSKLAPNEITNSLPSEELDKLKDALPKVIRCCELLKKEIMQ